MADKTTKPEPNELEVILNKLLGHDDGVEFGNGYHDDCKNEINEAKAQLTSLIDKAVIEARIDELDLLHKFLKKHHLFDQDSAMKLRWHYDDRIKNLQDKEEL